MSGSWPDSNRRAGEVTRYWKAYPQGEGFVAPVRCFHAAPAAPKTRAPATATTEIIA